jgi:hypothetical protein
MSDLILIREDNPRLIFEALLETDSPVLLLGPGQALKPHAEASLLEAAREGTRWVGASPHPDMPAGAYGNWLFASGRPPFGPGKGRHIRVWGLLGDPSAWTAALSSCLQNLPEGCDWQPWFLVELAKRGVHPLPVALPWLFQERLPALDEALKEEERRGACFSELERRGMLGPDYRPEAPVAGSEVPEDWKRTALSLANVERTALKGTQVAGMSGEELVSALTDASMRRTFELAYTKGFRGTSAPPAIARNVKRIAVIHPAYGGSLNLARRSSIALQRLGYEVVRVDPSSRAPEVVAAMKRGDGEALFRNLEQECLQAVMDSKPQAVWVLAQAPLGPGALRTLSRQGILSAYWFCEDYRVRRTWRDIAPAVDAFFPMQGGAFADALASLGVSVFDPLPACAASDFCAAPLPPEPSHPLSFFGAPYANRIRFFEALADLPLELFGEGWMESATPQLKNHVRDGSRLSEAQGIELFRQSAVNLNLHSSPCLHGVDPEGDYVNPRTFEIAASGSFQICDRRRDLPAAFVEDLEIPVFSTVAELRELIQRFLRDPDGRRRRAAAARKRVAAEHTYEHRLETALKTLGLPIFSRTSAEIPQFG